MPTFIEFLGNKKPSGVSWEAYQAWANSEDLDKFLMAPAKTPADAINALQGALQKALATKIVQDRFLATGAELVPADLQDSKGFAAYIKKEFDATAEAAKDAGLKPS